MKTCKRVMKIVAVYFILFVSINVVFSLAYYFVGISNDLSYEKILFYAISDEIGMQSFDNENWFVLVSFQQFLEVVCTSVMTGFILRVILTKEPKIVFPDKLVIRYTTQDNGKVLSLGILLGNRNKNIIYDAECILQLIYKPEEGRRKIVDKTEKVFFIENYYRFSFPLESKVPNGIIGHLVENMKKDARHDDEINVSIRGYFIAKGNTFLISKKYRLEDIIIAKNDHSNIEKDIKIPILGKTVRYIDWKAINQYEEVSEEERKQIIAEMEDIIRSECKSE